MIKPYSRFHTRIVNVGDVAIGGDNPIRIQSMTSSDTMNTEAVVEEIVDLHRAGAEFVRVTAPGLREAENLKQIGRRISASSLRIPLVADIHFSPRAAMIALEYCDKVRINPGNFADRKKFEIMTYTDRDYEDELDRVRDSFIPFVKRAGELGRSIRIGVNHGSLSDRIMSRYGDTPEGMVESALEFIRFSREIGFHDIVVSMKASHPGVMVTAYRRLVRSFLELGFDYPLHLGVTEAGEGRDGRIKSAAGIGSLLESGIGDTVRVSLTEDSVFEIPVARSIAERYDALTRKYFSIPFELDFVESAPRKTKGNAGAPSGLNRAPIGMLIDSRFYSPELLAGLKEAGADLFLLPTEHDNAGRVIHSEIIYNHTEFRIIHEINLNDCGVYLRDILSELIRYDPPGLSIIVSLTNPDSPGRLTALMEVLTELLSPERLLLITFRADRPDSLDYGAEFIRGVRERFPSVYFSILCPYRTDDPIGITRMYRALNGMFGDSEDRPILIRTRFESAESALLLTSIHAGGLFLQGIGEGLIMETEIPAEPSDLLSTGLDLLQAVRRRIARADFISCPSCGRTLFNIQEATRRIKERTSHLRGVRIAVMGCIVNGPGEMADADFGYVGAGPGRIHLYRGKEVVRKNLPEQEAVETLIDLIRESGLWMESENQRAVQSTFK